MMEDIDRFPDDILENFVERREGFRPLPYLDGNRVPTIGMGTTIYPNGKKVTLNDRAITHEQALAYMRHDFEKATKTVNKVITKYMTQNEFSAMISLTYNIGCEAFTTSTLARLFNSGAAKEVVAAQFPRWNKDNGKIVKGLVTRRKLEQELFLGA